MHLRGRLKKDASRLANVFALISVGMVVIGHLHFSFLLCALKRPGYPLGVLGSRGILSWALYGSCWLSIPQKLGCGIDSQGVASAQCALLPSASIEHSVYENDQSSRIIQAELLLLTPPASFVCECTMANQQWRLVMPLRIQCLGMTKTCCASLGVTAFSRPSFCPIGNLLTAPQKPHLTRRISGHGLLPCRLLLAMAISLVFPGTRRLSQRLQNDCFSSGVSRICDFRDTALS
jgi:hypothetical protein